MTRRRYTIVRSKPEADAILSGALTSFIVRPVHSARMGAPPNTRSRFEPIWSLPEPTRRRVLWGQSDYVFKGDYELELAENTVFDFEDATIEIVGRRFAQSSSSI